MAWVARVLAARDIAMGLTLSPSECERKCERVSSWEVMVWS